MFAPEPVAAVRIVARPEALDGLAPPPGATALRLAPDDLLLLSADAPAVDDPDALVETDAGWAGAWLAPDDAVALLRRHADWPAPPTGLAQGALAGVPVKLLTGGDRTLLLVPAVYVAELLERVT